MAVRAVAGRLHWRGDGQRQPEFILFWTAIALISFAFALGKNTPLYPWLYQNVPTFDMFQGPTRFSLWAELALPLLAGFGVQAWQRPVGWGLYWTRLGTAGAFAVAVGAGLAWAALGISATFLRAAVLAGLCGVGIGALSLLAPTSRAMQTPARDSTRWSWAVLLFVAADLLVAGWGLIPSVDSDLYTKNAQAPISDLSGQGRLYLTSTDEYRLKFNSFFSFKTFSPTGDWQDLRASLLPDAHLLDGLSSANNFDPLVPGRYAQWMGALEAVEPANRERLLNFMGVGVVEIVENFTEAGEGPVGEQWVVRFEERATPRRVRWIPCAIPAAGPADSLAQAFSAGHDLESRVIVEGLPMSQSQCPNEEQRNLQPVLEPYILTEEPGKLSIRFSASQAGWLVLSDVWYPGWKARVNGQPAPVWRANFLFRAVQVPEGTDEVLFVYQPISFSLGAALSSVAWAAMGAAVLGRRARPSSVSSKEKPLLHPETAA
jgi:hypothetical protein